MDSRRDDNNIREMLEGGKEREESRECGGDFSGDGTKTRLRSREEEKKNNEKEEAGV